MARRQRLDAELVRRQLVGSRTDAAKAIDHRRVLVNGALADKASRQVHPGVWWLAAQNTEAWLHLRFDAERSRSGGPLHSLRGVAGSYGVTPAPWFTRFLVELEFGQRLDVTNDRVGRGAVWLVEAKLRASLPNGWGVESEQRVHRAPPAALPRDRLPEPAHREHRLRR